MTEPEEELSSEVLPRALPRCGVSGRIAFAAALAMLALVYAIQIPTPLRINQDAADLLDLASKLTDGQPFLLHGLKPVFPIGMPLVFSLMERCRIANSSGFITLNFICIVIAWVSATTISKRLSLPPVHAQWSLIIAFSSFILLKHAVIPLTDVPYMAASLAAVALLEKAQDTNLPQVRVLILWLVSAALLAVAATLIRRVGIALIPAFFYVLCSGCLRSTHWRDRVRGKSLLAVSLIIALSIAAITVLLLHHYLLYLPDLPGSAYFGGPLQKASEIIFLRTSELGEVLLNVPKAKLRGLHDLSTCAGIVLTFLLLAGIWKARRVLRPAHVYLLSYLAILYMWPYGDHRFWLPVLPLLALVSLQALEPLMQYTPARALIYAYTTIYLLLFLTAAAFTTRITYSARFPETYADGQSAAEYNAAWSNGAVETETSRMIRRYGMR
jgi:hypothetical protein